MNQKHYLEILEGVRKILSRSDIKALNEGKAITIPAPSKIIRMYFEGDPNYTQKSLVQMIEKIGRTFGCRLQLECYFTDVGFVYHFLLSPLPEIDEDDGPNACFDFSNEHPEQEESNLGPIMATPKVMAKTVGA